MSAPAPERPPGRPSRPRRWWRRLVNAFAVVGLVFVVYHAGFHVSVIVSPSMAPTLQGDPKTQQDYVLSERVTLWFRDPRRWEVVEFVTPDGYQVMKRVVALPGETVSLVKGKVVVGGATVESPSSLGFLYYYAYGYYGKKGDVPCGDGYFVLGDDSKDSDDSRYNGPLALAEVRYRAWLRVWPLSRFGFVNP